MLKALKHFNTKTLLAFTISALLITFGCGKRKPPLPPVEKVPQTVEISGFQRGNQFFINWIMPARNATDSSVLNIDRIDVYRLTEPLSSPLVLSEAEFSSKSTLIATIPVSADDFAKKMLSFTDTISFTDQEARLRYSLRFANKTGQKASFSNFLLIKPTATVAEPPDELELNLSQDQVKLSWLAPQINIDRSRPANILGYNVYRTAGSAKTVKLLNNSPLTKNEFSDKFFEFGQNYVYFVRTVSLGRDAEPIESSDSKTIEITPLDKFAPGAPDSITIAVAPNQISIFFAANPEKDVVGYRVYRSIDKNDPLKNWVLLTEKAITTNTFQDSNVESGKTYFYYLTAVDIYGNVSEPSEIVSETVP